MKLCENIRLYRQKKDMTQEQLAEVLGVSVQAISRWETQATYPDITLLPTIASFFDVSLDDLMGMKEFRDEKALDEIWKKIKECEAQGDVRDAIELLRTALKRYPNNYELLLDLSLQLSWLNPEEGEDEVNFLNESLQIAERILRECSDQRIQNNTNGQLVFIYQRMGNTAKAIDLAQKLPNIGNTSESRLLYLYSGEKQREHAKWLLCVLEKEMGLAIRVLADLDYQRTDLSTENRIAILQKSLDLSKLIYDGKDYGYENKRVAQDHHYIADMEIIIGHEEEALYHLEQAAKHAVLCATLPEKVSHTSLLLNGISYDEKYTIKNYSFTECDELYDKMQQKRYDAIRETERFQAILKKISPCLTK